MVWLWAVSLLWAFSFGLIKGRLGGLDAGFVAFARLGLAALALLPWLRVRSLPRPVLARLCAVGAVQFGLMYVLYNAAFAHLAAWQVALFSVATPVHVVLLTDALERRVRAVPLALAALSVAGASVLQLRDDVSGATWTGFWLVQASNLCFAAGQVAWRRVAASTGVRALDVHALLYASGAVVAAMGATLRDGWSSWSRVDGPAALTLAWLGLAASGLGFLGFNHGATRVSSTTLAVVNNLKVPLAVLVSLVVFGESADLVRLGVGGGVLVAATWLAERDARRAT